MSGSSVGPGRWRRALGVLLALGLCAAAGARGGAAQVTGCEVTRAGTVWFFGIEGARVAYASGPLALLGGHAVPRRRRADRADALTVDDGPLQAAGNVRLRRGDQTGTADSLASDPATRAGAARRRAPGRAWQHAAGARHPARAHGRRR